MQKKNLQSLILFDNISITIYKYIRKGQIRYGKYVL